MGQPSSQDRLRATNGPSTLHNDGFACTRLIRWCRLQPTGCLVQVFRIRTITDMKIGLEWYASIQIAHRAFLVTVILVSAPEGCISGAISRNALATLASFEHRSRRTTGRCYESE